MEQTEELEYLIGLLTKELAAKPEHIRAVIRLLDEAGNGKGRSWDDVYTGSALGEGGRDSQEA